MQMKEIEQQVLEELAIESRARILEYEELYRPLYEELSDLEEKLKDYTQIKAEPVKDGWEQIDEDTVRINSELAIYIYKNQVLTNFNFSNIAIPIEPRGQDFYLRKMPNGSWLAEPIDQEVFYG